MEDLINFIIEEAKNANKESKEADTQYQKGYLDGKKDSFLLAVKWIEEKLIQIRNEKIFEE